MSTFKTSPVISVLNDVLSGEITAINQYFVHAELCAHWGFGKLHDAIRKQSIGEMKHAEELIERLLFLGGLPNLQRIGKVNIGETVRELMTADLALEQQALTLLRPGIATCLSENDHGSRALLERILLSEEEHVDWLETQGGLIERLGDTIYLAEQMS